METNGKQATVKVHIVKHIRPRQQRLASTVNGRKSIVSCAHFRWDWTDEAKQRHQRAHTAQREAGSSGADTPAPDEDVARLQEHRSVSLTALDLHHSDGPIPAETR
eukprot:6180169-Pleurochrysis_carterae.AAC.1